MRCTASSCRSISLHIASSAMKIPQFLVILLQSILYSSYSDPGVDLFLAEIVYEVVGRFDDAKRPEAAVAYHKDDKT